MGTLRDLLNSAKHNNSEAVMELYKRCQPTIKSTATSTENLMRTCTRTL